MAKKVLTSSNTWHLGVSLLKFLYLISSCTCVPSFMILSQTEVLLCFSDLTDLTIKFMIVNIFLKSYQERFTETKHTFQIPTPITKHIITMFFRNVIKQDHAAILPCLISSTHWPFVSVIIFRWFEIQLRQKGFKVINLEAILGYLIKITLLNSVLSKIFRVQKSAKNAL